MGAAIRFDPSLEDQYREELALPCWVEGCDEAEWVVYLKHRRYGCGVTRYYCADHKMQMEGRYLKWLASNPPRCSNCFEPITDTNLGTHFKAMRL